MPVYKLLYFPARARAEVARLLFAAAGQNFEDQRLPFEQWGTVKASKSLNIIQLCLHTISKHVLISFHFS